MNFEADRSKNRTATHTTEAQSLLRFLPKRREEEPKLIERRIGPRSSGVQFRCSPRSGNRCCAANTGVGVGERTKGLTLKAVQSAARVIERAGFSARGKGRKLAELKGTRRATTEPGGWTREDGGGFY